MSDKESSIDWDIEMAGDLSFVDDCSNEPADIEESREIMEGHRDTPTQIRDFPVYFAPSPRQQSARGRARLERARISNHYQRSLNSTCGQTPERSHRPVVRTLSYDSSPEHLSSRLSGPPASSMPGRIFMIDHRRPQPILEGQRQPDPPAPERNNGRNESPRERNARRAVTRLLNHARVNPTLNEQALRCPNCKLLPTLPVTGMCGKTRCRGCIRRFPRCSCGKTHNSRLMNVNVLVQDIVQKILLTEQDVRRWLWESGALIVLLRQESDLADSRRAGGASGADTPQVEAGNDDKSDEEGAWSLPEAEVRQRRLEAQMAINKVPLTPRARFLYGSFLMRAFRYLEAIPHLTRAALDSAIVSQARQQLYKALLELSHIHVLDDIEGEIRQRITAQAASTSVSSRDLECSLCLETFIHPITTRCGHTFCHRCLERSLDYRPTCALCMRSMENFQLNNAGVNQFVTSTLRSIGKEKIQEPLDPRVIPILVCTVAFPAMPCPLIIFNPRSWFMIRRILETNSRTFGMLARERDGTPSEYGTILEIKDCVHLEDGCTIVTTVGLSRFRVIERTLWRGWCEVARVEAVADLPVESEEDVAQLRYLANAVAYKANVWLRSIDQILRAKIETAFGFSPSLDARGPWWTRPDGPSWLWWLISVLPLREDMKVLILSSNSLSKRMRAVLCLLNTSMAQPPHCFYAYEAGLAEWWRQRRP